MTDEIVKQPLRDILSCVMAQPGTSPRTVFARSETGQVLHISTVETGTKGLFCQNCNGALVAKPGKGKRVPHFAHKSDAECRSAGETEAHLMAKEVIEGAGGLLLPAFEVATGARKRVALHEQWFTFERIEVEASEEGFRPDLVGYARTSDGGELRRLMIEVYVTHRVGEAKLSRLRAAGESAIEIDLSKIDRNLTGPEFEEQILKAAPRRWLYHRAAASLRRKVYDEEEREASKKERQKAFAIRKEAEREEERQRARETRPRKPAARTLNWALDERENWRALDMGELFERVADDGIFDLEAIVWRSWVLSILAPWKEKSYRLPDASGLRKTAVNLGRQMRERGWVKEPFARELKKFREKRYQPWDPVADEIEMFFLDGMREYGFGGIRREDGVSLASVGRAVETAWEERIAWAHKVLVLTAKVEQHGAEVWLYGKRLVTGGGIEMVLSALGGRPIGNAPSLVDMSYEIETGRPRYSIRHDADFYTAQGLALSLPGDGDVDIDESSTARTLSHIRACHRWDWQRELEDWVQAEASRLLSVFRKLSGQGLLPGEELAAAGVEFLFDEDALRGRIYRPLPDEGRDPLAIARKESEKKIAGFDGLVRRLELLGEIASVGEACGTREIIVREGLRAAFAQGEGQGFLRSMSDSMRPTLLKAMEDLRRFSERWGYGEDFPTRALVSSPTWTDQRLVDLMFGGEIVPFRRAMNEIITRRQPPSWVAASM